jgi:hypothetical protein
VTFSLANNGVSSFSISTTVGMPFLPTNRLISSQVHLVTGPVAATGSEISGGFTPFHLFFLSLSLFNIIFDPWNLYQHDLLANATPSHWWRL